jgi:hypothetical protein
VIDAEPLFRPRVTERGLRQVPICHHDHVAPCNAPTLAAAPERAEPVPDGVAPKVAKGFEVGWDCMIGKVALHNSPEPTPLFLDRPVGSSTQSRLDILEFGFEAVALGTSPELEGLAVLLGPADMRQL